MRKPCTHLNAVQIFKTGTTADKMAGIAFMQHLLPDTSQRPPPPLRNRRDILIKVKACRSGIHARMLDSPGLISTIIVYINNTVYTPVLHAFSDIDV